MVFRHSHGNFEGFPAGGNGKFAAFYFPRFLCWSCLCWEVLMCSLLSRINLFESLSHCKVGSSHCCHIPLCHQWPSAFLPSPPSISRKQVTNKFTFPNTCWRWHVFTTSLVAWFYDSPHINFKPLFCFSKGWEHPIASKTNPEPSKIKAIRSGFVPKWWMIIQTSHSRCSINLWQQQWFAVTALFALVMSNVVVQQKGAGWSKSFPHLCISYH